MPESGCNRSPVINPVSRFLNIPPYFCQEGTLRICAAGPGLFCLKYTILFFYPDCRIKQSE